MALKLEHGDCLDLLRATPDESIDAVVCDPPYGLSQIEPGDVVEALRCWLEGKPYKSTRRGFLGKEWDSFVPGPEVWKECFRVLKPGGHLLAFAGTRTMDLMGISIRLAGLEMRDSIGCDGILRWEYGQGFPKSLDVSSAIDKRQGAKREILADSPYKRSDEAERRSEGKAQSGATSHAPITAPATALAEEWDGWGTALKPSWEPVLVFRKPLLGTVAENVLKHGTGGINVDGCRVGTSKRVPGGEPSQAGNHVFGKANLRTADEAGRNPNEGRFPPNTLLVHHPDCRKTGQAEVDGGAGTDCPHWPDPCRGHGDAGKSQSGATTHGNPPPGWACVDGCRVKAMGEKSGDLRARGNIGASKGGGGMYGHGKCENDFGAGEPGTAARFFPQFQYELDDFYYCGKASRADRGEGNAHPTVKPSALMQWLCRLVCPKGGTILDPFMGSGTTGVAALREGFNFVGFELEEGHVAIARERLEKESRKGVQLSMGAVVSKVKLGTK